MTTKNLVALGGVAAVAVAAALLAGDGSSRRPSQLNGREIAPGLSLADVASVEIGDGRLRLAAGEKGWTVATYQDYPADRAKIAANLLRLRELRVGQVARGRELGKETPVVLRDAAGKALLELRLGDAHMAKGGYYPDGRYLAFGGETVLVKDALEAFDGDAKAWIDTKIADEPWISFKDLADPKLTPEELGMATGVTAKVTVAGDTNRVATVGAAVAGGTDRYLRLDNAPWTFVVPSYSVEKLLPKPEEKPEAKPEKQPEAKPDEQPEAKPEPAAAEAKPEAVETNPEPAKAS